MVVCLLINIVIYAIISLLLKYNLEKKGWTSYNVAYLNARNSYTTVLKQYHKFGVGRNHGDNMAPSFLNSHPKTDFFKSHSFGFLLKHWVHWLFNQKMNCC